MTSVEVQIARIQAQLEQVLSLLKEAKERHDDQEDRIRKVESFSAKVLGALAIVSVLSGSIVAKLFL